MLWMKGKEIPWKRSEGLKKEGEGRYDKRRGRGLGRRGRGGGGSKQYDIAQPI